MSQSLTHELAFLFPGQGSQSKGMLADFLASEAVVQDTFTEASDALAYDMKALVLDDVESKLDQTNYTQPALLTASTALFRLWQTRGGVMPAQMAGHSLGEYSALVAAGVLNFRDAVALVAFRGQAMMQAVPAGAGKMAAIIGLDDAKLVALCESVSTDLKKVWAANFNCPGQLVVAGHAAAVEALMVAAKEAGAKRALPLAVSAPSHTPLMQPAADAMQEKLSGMLFNAPLCPVWSNARAVALHDIEDIRAALVEQLVSPVRWTETIQAMRTSGIAEAVEMGPGKVLSGLVRRVDKNLPVASILTSYLMDKAVEL
ncbi:MAG: ACP S-malonyltransferase [Mariprofundaceae bacterium]|nr:ACP S-malonyltransferase [Mariprofundaceae bacterium]